ncbi:MAG: BON domain-containing protein [Parachlamydiaceae bacterium]
MRSLIKLLVFGSTSLCWTSLAYSDPYQQETSSMPASTQQGYYNQGNSQGRQQQQSPLKQMYAQPYRYNKQPSTPYSGMPQTNTGAQGTLAENTPKMPSDSEITQSIQDLLGTDAFSTRFKKVTFDVNNRTVTLRGSVDTDEDKSKIGFAVKDINGVKRVHNHISVMKEIPKITRR